MGALSPLQLLNTVGTIATTALPVINTANQLVGAVRGFGEDPVAERQKDRRDLLLAQQDLALRQLQEKQAQGLSQQTAQTALDREKILADAEKAEQDRLSALRRAVARQRAQFGASGTGSSGGSAEAVLLGLFEETDEDRDARERLDNIRSRALDLGLSQQRSLNVLEQSQLQERQRLQRVAEGF